MSAAWCASCVEGRGGCFCGGVFCESEPLVCVFVCFFLVNSHAHHDGVAARVGLVLGHLSGRLAADVAAVLRARLFWKEK